MGPAHPSFRLTVQRASRTTLQPTLRQLKQWAGAALQSSAQVTIRLVDSREGRRLNRDFRGRDYPTNVLTFVYDPDASGLTGDLVLCAPVIKQEARKQKKPLLHHYAHLVIHGLLHLQGHDHMRKKEAQVMEALETTILKKLNIPDPYRDLAHA